MMFARQESSDFSTHSTEVSIFVTMFLFQNYLLHFLFIFHSIIPSGGHRKDQYVCRKRKILEYSLHMAEAYTHWLLSRPLASIIFSFPDCISDTIWYNLNFFLTCVTFSGCKDTPSIVSRIAHNLPEIWISADVQSSLFIQIWFSSLFIRSVHFLNDACFLHCLNRKYFWSLVCLVVSKPVGKSLTCRSCRHGQLLSTK